MKKIFLKWKKKEKKGGGRKTPQNCKSPMQRQRSLATTKSVTEYIHIPISKIKTVQQK